MPQHANRDWCSGAAARPGHLLAGDAGRELGEGIRPAGSAFVHLPNEPFATA